MTNVQQELNALKRVMEARNPELLIRLSPSHFGNEELAKLFLLIKKFYIDQGDWMGWDVLRSIVAQKCTTADKSRYLMSLLDQIQERDITGLTDDAMVQEMEAAGRCRAILDSIKEIALAAEQKDLEAVQGLYRRGYDEVFLQGDDTSLESANMFNMAGKKIKFRFNTSGVAPIDERGGLIEGGLFGIAGESKAGKSVMSLQWSIHNYVNNDESVAYFSYEQGRHEIRARLLANLSSIDIGKITTDDLTEEERLLLRLTELQLLFTADPAMKQFCLANTDKEEEEFFELARTTFEKLPKDFLIFDDPYDWDTLFVKMELLRTTKGISFFVIDYPYLVPRGATDKQLQTWEYNLLQSRKLKHFARMHTAKGRPTWVVVLAQYDSKEDNLRYVKGLINDLDMLLKIFQDKEDKEMGTVTCSHGGIFRNYISIPGKPSLEDFKLQRDFAFSRFTYVEF